MSSYCLNIHWEVGISVQNHTKLNSNLGPAWRPWVPSEKSEVLISALAVSHFILFFQDDSPDCKFWAGIVSFELIPIETC